MNDLDTTTASPATTGGADATTGSLDRKARAARVLDILDRTFPTVDIPLDHGDPFQLLVAVLLSAQCTDARVNLVTPALFARAPSAHAMAKLTPAQIMPFIRTCGLAPRKAQAIAETSRILVAQHGGEVPADLAALEALPGVGHKTASVVLSQAFNVPAFPVDTHIHRLAGRWQLSRARNVEEVEHDLKALFPPARWNTLHLQIIYFGRAYCPAKGHVPADCPICSWAMSKARADAERKQGLSKPVKNKPKAGAKLAKSAALKPAAQSATPKPAAKSATPKPAAKSATPKPAAKSAAPKPAATKPAAPKPAAPKAAKAKSR